MKQGFSLAEILMALAIMGILSTVIFVSLAATREKGTDADRISTIRSAQQAMQLAKDTFTGDYPTYTNELAAQIGLNASGHLNGWREGVEFVDNTSDNRDFCIYTILDQAVPTERHFVGSPAGTGYRDNLPILGSCNPDPV